MQSRFAAVWATTILLGCLPLYGQVVVFDVTPLSGPALNTGPVIVVSPPVSNTLTVLPGTIVPYELGVVVQPMPEFPNVNGLAAFDVDVRTDLGVPQPPLTAFAPQILTVFTLSPSLGTPLGDDILNIAASQDLSGFSNMSIGLGRRQILATGELNTPLVEGDFSVSAVGTADVLVTGVNPSQGILRPATVMSGQPLIIQTRVDAVVPADEGEVAGSPPVNPDAGTFPIQVCAPGLLAVLPGCMVGLLGLRQLARRR